MKVLSLFDGVSCGQVALERAGIPVEEYYASEIDKSAIKVTQKNYPNTKQLGDVRGVKGDELPKIDLLLGGSPCTGFSVAGKGLNFEDPQSKLFFEYVRILKEVNPKYFLLENVRMKQEYQDIITEYLGVEPILINSSIVSCQDRQRLYWTNIPHIKQPDEKVVKLSNILEKEVDEKYYIPDEVVKEIIEKEVEKGKVIKEAENVYIIHGKRVEIGKKTEEYSMPCITPKRVNKRQNGRRFKPSEAKFYTLTAQDKHGVLVDGKIRLLTPLEYERLQTLKEEYTEGISENKRYKCIGNGWTVNIIVEILKNIKETSGAM